MKNQLSLMFEPTSEEQAESLKAKGYNQDGASNWTKQNENGSWDRVETDGDWRRSSNNNNVWEKD